MITQDKLIELRNSADTRLRALIAQSMQIQAELNRLHDQFELRTEQLHSAGRDIVDAQSALKAFSDVLDEPVAPPAPPG